MKEYLEIFLYGLLVCNPIVVLFAGTEFLASFSKKNVVLLFLFSFVFFHIIYGIQEYFILNFHLYLFIFPVYILLFSIFFHFYYRFLYLRDTLANWDKKRFLKDFIAHFSYTTGITFLILSKHNSSYFQTILLFLGALAGSLLIFMLISACSKNLIYKKKFFSGVKEKILTFTLFFLIISSFVLTFHLLKLSGSL